MVARFVRKADTTFDTKAFAVLLAHRLERQRGHHCVPEHRLQVDEIIDDLVLVYILLLGQFIAFKEEQLLYVGLEVVRDGLQAPATFPGNTRERCTGNQDSLVYGLESKIQIYIRSLFDSDQCRPHFTGSGHGPFKSLHGTGGTPEFLGRKDQRRAAIYSA